MVGSTLRSRRTSRGGSSVADLLREFVTWISVSTGLRIGGGSAPNASDRLYAGHVPPEKPDLAALVREVGGEDQLLTADAARIGRPAFQVLVRGPSFFQARELAWTIHAAIHGAAFEVLGDHTLHVAEAVARPQSLGFDEQRRHLISTTYALRAHDDSGASP